MATANGNIEVEFVFITKDELRKLIAEEIRKAVEPGAIRPPYLPPVPAPQWWQSPVTSIDVKDYPNVTYSDERGTAL